MRALPDKWTAFWLSLLFPGVGQLAAGSWSAAVWIAGAIGAALLIASSSADSSTFNPLAIVVLGVVGLLSAEHAKRLLETKPLAGRDLTMRGRCLRRRVVWDRGRGRSFSVLMSLEFARPAAELWPIVADAPRFLTIDPFHDRVTLQQLPAAKGVDLVLSHNAFGVRFLRFGRIITWNEGQGYAYSDLSGRDKRQGFPHVFIVSIAATETAAADSQPRSTLTIRIRGRWTSRWIPIAFGRLWVSWVCREHARLLSKAL